MLNANHHRLPLFLPVLVGCGVALYFGQEAPTPFWPYMLTAALALGLFLKGWNHTWLRLSAAAIFALMLGASAAALRLHMVEAPVLREPIFFKPVSGVVEDLQHKEKKTKLILRDVTVEGLEAKDTPKRVSISILKIPEMLALGTRIQLPAMLFLPPSPVMPEAYDFARMFYFDQLGAVGFSPRRPEILDARSTSHESRITALRLAISDHLVAVMGAEAGAIASALMVGEQSRVSDEVSDSMRASGIYHILSISGLHMALATGMVFFLARLLLVIIPFAALHWPIKKISAVLALIAGAGYLLLAGAPVPAIRSYIMVACVLVAVLADRKGISMYSLGWAATLILLFMPESLFSASFQLSFAATLAIVGLYERYGQLLFHAQAGLFQRCLLYFLGLMLTSLAATFYTSPLAIAHFNRMAIYGVLANMLVVPLSSIVIMPAALVAFVTMPFGVDTIPLIVLKWGLEIMMAMSRFVEHFPYANITLPSPSNAGFLLMIAGGLWFVLWGTRIRYIGLALLASGLATIVFFKPYDVIISDDAKRIAYRSADNRWVMLRGDVDSFEAEIWLRSQGQEMMLSRKQALLIMPELRCDKTSCMVTREGKTLLVSIKKSDDDYCTSGADIIVTDRFLTCDHISHIIDRGFVESHGATALRFSGGMLQLSTAQESRGHWPWVTGVYPERNAVESKDPHPLAGDPSASLGMK